MKPTINNINVTKKINGEIYVKDFAYLSLVYTLSHIHDFLPHNVSTRIKTIKTSHTTDNDKLTIQLKVDQGHPYDFVYLMFIFRKNGIIKALGHLNSFNGDKYEPTNEIAEHFLMDTSFQPKDVLLVTKDVDPDTDLKSTILVPSIHNVTDFNEFAKYSLLPILQQYTQLYFNLIDTY